MSDETMSLYFQLAPGEKADLELAAAAAIAWSQGLKAAARAIDPDAIVRIELIDADEASLSFNTIMRWIDSLESHLARVERGLEKHKRVRKLAAALGVMLVVTGPATWDLYFGEDKFTPEDRVMLKDLHSRVIADPDVKAAKGEFYRAVLADPSIVGVGVKERPSDKPVFIVPQNQFAEGEGLWERPQLFTDQRTRYREMQVVIVKPALVKSARSWTVREEGLPEFDAIMRDPLVLATGGLPESMTEGVTITVRMEFKEKLVDGEWQLTRGGRSIVEVIDPKLN